jgi:hypothetical protein
VAMPKVILGSATMETPAVNHHATISRPELVLSVVILVGHSR